MNGTLNTASPGENTSSLWLHPVDVRKAIQEKKGDGEGNKGIERFNPNEALRCVGRRRHHRSGRFSQEGESKVGFVTVAWRGRDGLRIAGYSPASWREEDSLPILHNKARTLLMEERNDRNA